MLIYTDLKDKNNNRIFSNSVLVVDTETSREVGNVYFSRGSFMWRTKILSTINSNSIVLSEQSCSKSLGWFDELDKYKLSTTPPNFSTIFPDDCTRIRDSFKKMGVRISMETAQDVWIQHSESQMAGWLYLPDDSSELNDILQNYIPLVQKNPNT